MNMGRIHNQILSLSLIFISIACGKNVYKQPPLVIEDANSASPQVISTPESTEGLDQGSEIDTTDIEGDFCTIEACDEEPSTLPTGMMHASGYIVLPRWFDPWDAFVYVNGQSYFVGSQTSTQVRSLMNILPPGIYLIRGMGTVGVESGHRPNPSMTYPVIHINSTY